MQGRLRGNELAVEIDSSCVHCCEPIRLEVTSDLSHRVNEGCPLPLVFEPDVDWSTFSEPSIINAY